MAEAFIVRRGGGGGSGATLVVTSAGAGTVTVSNSTLGKSYSKTVTAGGSVAFKGLKTGDWTVTVSNGTQTATRSVTINADYSVSVAYFSATISITYPAKSTCVVKNSGGQTVASDTNTGSSTKAWTATVGATGTYTVTATATDGSGKTKSTTVSITTDGQSSSVTLAYELVLYDSGDQIEAVTGGWGSRWVDGQGVVFNADYIHINGLKSNYYGIVSPNNPVDVTNYSKLIISVSSAINDCYFGLNPNQYTSQNSLPTTASKVFYASGIHELDISSVSGLYYVGIVAKADDNSSCDITKVWAE